jgi:hypothetical protein
MSETNAYEPLVLRKDPLANIPGQGRKIGNLVTREGREVSVKVQTYNSGRSYEISIASGGSYRRVGSVEKFGAGANQGWTFYEKGDDRIHPWTEHGTLESAVERFVLGVIGNEEYRDRRAAVQEAVQAVLPYRYDDEAHAQASLVVPGDKVAVALVGTAHLNGTFVGYFYPEQADAIVAQVEAILSEANYNGSVRVYGKVHPQEVVLALREQGVSDASFSSDHTEAQIYFNNGNSALLIGKDGALAEVTWDRSGGVQREVEVDQVSSTEEAIRAALLWNYQHGLRERAQALLDYLQQEVPPSVIHWAVESAKPALRDLVHFADAIDFLHGREVQV